MHSSLFGMRMFEYWDNLPVENFNYSLQDLSKDKGLFMYMIKQYHYLGIVH